MQGENTLETVSLPFGSSNGDAATTEFRKKIDESKIQMQAEIPAAKRGRGRPRKKPLPLNTTVTNAAPSAPAVEKVENPPGDISGLLVPPLIGLSKIPAAHYGVAEIALTEEEARICAQSLNQLLQVLVPDVTQLDPRTAAIIGFCTTVSTIGFSKYQIYQSKIKTSASLAPSTAEVPAKPGASPFPMERGPEVGQATPAEAYFAARAAG